jgi:hypothetical protein
MSIMLASDLFPITSVDILARNHTTESRQGSLLTYCSSGFYVLLMIHIFIFEVRKTNGNLLWTLGQEGGTSIIDHKGANFYPLSCVMSYFIKCERLKALNLMFLTWSLTLLTKLNQATSDNEVKIIQGDCCILRGRN